VNPDGLSRETRQRRLPINGGTWICSRCDQRRVPGSAYCREHKNEVQREWDRKKTDEVKRALERLKSLELSLTKAHSNDA
jgi:hypothetical protein